jgi:type VI secretion system protein ImpJ
MSVYSKVVWSEGLFLRPQHLQQQDRYFERYIETRCQALRSHSWGLSELELERDLLSIGQLGLARAAGVFPDGTPFRMPDDTPLPAPLELDPRIRDQLMYLAVPLRQPGDTEAGRDAGRDSTIRNSITEVEARDTTTISGQPVLLEAAALRTRIMAERDAADGFARIPIAHVIECRADQRVVLEDRFIPTVLDARAAPRLATFMTELLGLLHTRGEALGARATSTGRSASAEIADYLLLQAINRAEALLAHLVDSGSLHPEDLYRFCVALAGELATFTAASRRRTAFQRYRHERLRESFEPVVAALRAAFSVVIESSAIPIPVVAKRFGVSVAVVADHSLFSSAVFVLAARAEMAADELRRMFPGMLKIAPAEQISTYVRQQVAGLPVHSIPVAPRQIPVHAGFVYFELDQSHELWKQLAASGGVAFHVAGDVPGLTLEFWAVRSG